MPWADEQWAAFAAILQRGFASREPFTDADANVYRLLLDGVDPDAAARALRELVQEGQALRPKPGEIVARIRRDPSRPTFDEAYRLIFGRGGILRARPTRQVFHDEEVDGRLVTAAEAKRRAEVLAIEEACAAAHPLVGQFVIRHGVDRLRQMQLEDPDYGSLRRAELNAAWDAHVDAFDGREVAALAAGGDTHARLHRMDPLAALGLGQPAAALPEGAR